MNRWRRLWLIIKLMAAVAACVAVAVQAFLYMLDSPDAAQIHPLSIVVAGLIFGFITFGVLSLIEIGFLGLVGFFLPALLHLQQHLRAMKGFRRKAHLLCNLTTRLIRKICEPTIFSLRRKRCGRILQREFRAYATVRIFLLRTQIRPRLIEGIFDL